MTDRFIRKSPARQILIGPLSVWLLHLIIKIFSRFPVDLQDPAAKICLLSGLGTFLLLRQFDPGTVRQCLQSGDWETLKTLLPQTSLDYFRSPEAGPVLAHIRSAGNVVHY